MEGLGDVPDARRDRRTGSAERDNVERLAERDERANETVDIATDTGSGGYERPAVDSDAEIYRISICSRRTGRSMRSQMSRIWRSMLPLTAALLRMTSSIACRSMACAR